MPSGQAESNVQNSSTYDVENEHHGSMAVNGDGESSLRPVESEVCFVWWTRNFPCYWDYYYFFFSICCFMNLLLNQPWPEHNQADYYQDTGVVPVSKEDLASLDKGSKSCSSGQRAEKCQEDDCKEDVPRSSKKHDTNAGAKAVPLGLGLGGLERKVKQFCFNIKLFYGIFYMFLWNFYIILLCMVSY